MKFVINIFWKINPLGLLNSSHYTIKQYNVFFLREACGGCVVILSRCQDSKITRKR